MPFDLNIGVEFWRRKDDIQVEKVWVLRDSLVLQFALFFPCHLSDPLLFPPLILPSHHHLPLCFCFTPLFPKTLLQVKTIVFVVSGPKMCNEGRGKAKDMCAGMGWEMKK